MKEKNRPSNSIFEIWICMGMGLLVLCLYHSALKGWWRWDDTVILKQALCQTPFDYFLSPKAYQVLSLKNFTPLLIFSFDTDLHFIGLDPGRFYVQQLIDLWLSGIVSYFLLRLWVIKRWAALGGVLCIVGAPVAATVEQLMTRHYVEGLLFSLIALYLFLVSVRGKRFFASFLGAAFYFLAMGSKEIFVPLSVLCFFWPEGSLKKRLVTSIPNFLALSLYILWRKFMIGIVGGGYRIYWESVVSFPVKFCQAFFGNDRLSLVVGMIAAAVLLMYLVKKSPARAMFAAVLISSVIGPLIPLGPDISALRYFFVPWWVFAMTITVVLGKGCMNEKVTAIVNPLIFYFVTFFALFQGHMGVQPLDDMIKRFDTQGRFLWESQKSHVMLYSPVTSHFGHYFSGLNWLKIHKTGTDQTFNIMGDEIELALNDDSAEEIWAYDKESNSIQDISKKIPQILATWQEKQRLMPLSFRLDYGKDKTAIWQCGPYSSGTYTLLIRDEKSEYDTFKISGMTKFPLSPSGQWRANLATPVCFYLRYDSPLGWTTYSPLLHFDPGKEHFQWIREKVSNNLDTTNNITE